MCKLDQGDERQILESTITLLNKHLKKELEIEVKTLKFIVSDVLYYWVYKNKVGIKKDTNIRLLYNEFFNLFLDILLEFKKNKENIEGYELATKCLYQGTIYRTVGYQDTNDELIFDDLYTHWSKIDTRNIDSIESKVFKSRDYLKVEIEKNDYAIYIAPFIGMKNYEEEVVFTTSSKYEDKMIVEHFYLTDEEYTIKKLNEINNIFSFPKCRCLEALIADYNFSNRNSKTC